MDSFATGRGAARFRFCLVQGLVVLLCALTPGWAAAQDSVDYTRAERLLDWNLALLIAGDQVEPEWMAGGNRFWYRNKTGDGHEFVLVDPVRNTRARLFDHDRMAAAMSVANDSSYVGRALPFDAFEFTGDAESTIAFRTNQKRFECDIRAYLCTVGDTLPSTVPFVTSPDERWDAFIHDHDLWIRPAGGGDSIRVTDDGEEYWSYGISAPRPSTIIRGVPVRPVLQWSPDSRRIAVQRMDEREVLHAPLYSSTTQRPRFWTFPYAQPGDSIIPLFDIHLIDVEQRTNVRIDDEPHPSPILGETGMFDSTWVTVKWAEESDRLYYTHSARGAKRTQLVTVELDGSGTRIIAKDTASTWVELKHGGRTPPNWAVVNGGDDVIWFSQRDGWGHLYRYGPDGSVKNQITSGPWVVDEIKHVDEARGHLYFTAWGAEDDRHPYHRHLYRINLDGSGQTLLTPEDADHTIRFTPSGRFIVDQYSTIAAPPVTVLRAVPDGRVLRTLETADISRIEELGWTGRTPFVAKGRDGVTDIHGVMSLPSDYDPAKRYPVLEYIYPGPQVGSVGTWSFSASGRGDVRAMAELGFVVVQIDHMGTPWRSKAFHDAYYANMGDHGLPDHIAVLQQLATRHPFMDLDRVGIWGHSGGGFASTAAILQYPDFYKVAVSSSGNHDNRTYGLYWGEKYQGLLVRDTVSGTDNFENQVNARLADNLEGKLFLMHGDLDDNVHPAMTLQVVNALIDANKSFDLLMVPDRYHGLNEPYVVRRRWDYFVEHLLGATPPTNYEIRRPAG